MKTTIKFKDLPRDYKSLCEKVFLPRPIRTVADYDSVAVIADAMAPHIDNFSTGQDEYFAMLAAVLEDYDRARITSPRVSGVAALQHLLDENSMTAADLSRLIGCSRNLGAMILRGDRNLTIDHIRTLSDRFAVSADLFIFQPKPARRAKPNKRELQKAA
jgi:HTH-type transcriptional regulator / antitoxin HigA